MLDELVTPVRSIILALVEQRLLSPGSKRVRTRSWHATSLADVCGVGDVRIDDVFAAMDCLIQRKGDVEERLAARHLGELQHRTPPGNPQLQPPRF
ncbi:MAG: hypothetical protein WD336_08910 [Trueperaceae bacterium]